MHFYEYELNPEISLAIKNVDDFILSRERHSDWGKQHLRRLRGRLRLARLNTAKAKGTHTNDEWLLMLEEFDYRCVKCGCHPEGRPCKDHIRAIFVGGSDGIDNLQPLCRECNSGKGDDFNWAAYRRNNGFDL